MYFDIENKLSVKNLPIPNVGHAFQHSKGCKIFFLHSVGEEALGCSSVFAEVCRNILSLGQCSGPCWSECPYWRGGPSWSGGSNCSSGPQWQCNGSPGDWWPMLEWWSWHRRGGLCWNGGLYGSGGPCSGGWYWKGDPCVSSGPCCSSGPRVAHHCLWQCTWSWATSERGRVGFLCYF